MYGNKWKQAIRISRSVIRERDKLSMNEHQKQVNSRLLLLKEKRIGDEILYARQGIDRKDLFTNIEDVRRKLGEGTYGAVYKSEICMSGSAKLCAKKKINIRNCNATEVMVPLLLGDQIEGLPELYAAVVHGPNIYIYSQIAEGGCLNQQEPTWGIGHIIFCVDRILSCIWKMHCRDVAHYDLKHMNIGFIGENRDPSKLLVFDCGSAKCNLRPPIVQNFTKRFAPPEWKKITCEKEFSEKFLQWDVWTIGCILYTLITGEDLWKDCTTDDILQYIEENKDTVLVKLNELDMQASPRMKMLIDLLKMLLTINPDQRKSVSAALNHEVFDIVKNPYVKVQVMRNKEVVMESFVPKGSTLQDLPSWLNPLRKNQQFSSDEIEEGLATLDDDVVLHLK